MVCTQLSFSCFPICTTFSSFQTVGPMGPTAGPHDQVTVFTDASSKGWGVGCDQASWKGTWKRENHINWLELRTVLIALQLLQFSIKGKVVLFMEDNTSAVSYLMKQGGTHSRALLKLTHRTLTFTRKLKVTLVAKHIPGQDNVLADMASRVGQV